MSNNATIDIPEGHWRISDSSNSIIRCPLEDISCIGGESSGDYLCAEGFEGVLCGEATSQHHIDWIFQDSQQCSDSNVMLSIIIPLIVLGSLLILVCCCVGNTSNHNTNTATNKVTIYQKLRNHISLRAFLPFSSTTTLALPALQNTDNSVKSQVTTTTDTTTASTVGRNFFCLHTLFSIKILIFVLQVSSSLPNALHMRLGFYASHVLRGLSYLSLPSLQALPWNCWAQSSLLSSVHVTSKIPDYLQQMELTTALPLGLCLLTTLLYILHMEVIYLTQHNRPQHQALHKHYTGLYGMCVLLCLYYISGSAWQLTAGTITAQCIQADPDQVYPDSNYRVLSRDVRVYCGTSSYQAGYLWAIVAALLFMVIAPALQVLLVYFYSDKIVIQQQRLAVQLSAEQSGGQVCEESDTSDSDQSDSSSSDSEDEEHRVGKRKKHTITTTTTGSSTIQNNNQKEKDKKKKELLSKHKQLIRTVSSHVLRKRRSSLYFTGIALIYQAYKAEWRYWELADLLARWVYLAVLPTLFPYKHPAQILLFIGTTLLFIQRLVSLQPYLHKTHQSLATCGLIQIFLLLLCAAAQDLGFQDVLVQEVSVLDIITCIVLLSTPLLWCYQVAVKRAAVHTPEPAAVAVQERSARQRTLGTAAAGGGSRRSQPRHTQHSGRSVLSSSRSRSRHSDRSVPSPSRSRSRHSDRSAPSPSRSQSRHSGRLVPSPSRSRSQSTYQRSLHTNAEVNRHRPYTAESAAVLTESDTPDTPSSNSHSGSSRLQYKSTKQSNHTRRQRTSQYSADPLTPARSGTTASSAVLSRSPGSGGLMFQHHQDLAFCTQETVTYDVLSSEQKHRQRYHRGEEQGEYYNDYSSSAEYKHNDESSTASDHDEAYPHYLHRTQRYTIASPRRTQGPPHKSAYNAQFSPPSPDSTPPSSDGEGLVSWGESYQQRNQQYYQQPLSSSGSIRSPSMIHLLPLSMSASKTHTGVAHPLQRPLSSLPPFPSLIPKFPTPPTPPVYERDDSPTTLYGTEEGTTQEVAGSPLVSYSPNAGIFPEECYHEFAQAPYPYIASLDYAWEGDPFTEVHDQMGPSVWDLYDESVAREEEMTRQQRLLKSTAVTTVAAEAPVQQCKDIENSTNIAATPIACPSTPTSVNAGCVHTVGTAGHTSSAIENLFSPRRTATSSSAANISTTSPSWKLFGRVRGVVAALKQRNKSPFTAKSPPSTECITRVDARQLQDDLEGAHSDDTKEGQKLDLFDPNTYFTTSDNCCNIEGLENCSSNSSDTTASIHQNEGNWEHPLGTEEVVLFDV